MPWHILVGWARSLGLLGFVSALLLGAGCESVDPVGLIERALWIMLASAGAGLCLGLAAAGVLSVGEGDDNGPQGATAGSTPE